MQRHLHPAPQEDALLIVSAGGNDALGHIEILYERALSFADVLARLAEIGERFEHGGAKIAEAIVRLAAEHDFRRRRTEVFVR